MPRTVLTLDELSATMRQLESVRGTAAGIGTTDPALAAYARVVEYGSVAGQPPWPQPGPRTTLAVNAESGQRVVVSAQAPQGYLRMHIAPMVESLAEELRRPVNWLDAAAAETQLVSAAMTAARRGVELARASVAHDSGRLAASLQAISLA
jgi:hypothetical protein